MEQYISKSALVAEIERLEKINQEYKKTWKWKFKWFYRTIIGRLEVLEGLKEFIDTLEVKEVNLEEEKVENIKKQCPFREVVCSKYQNHPLKCSGACAFVSDRITLEKKHLHDIQNIPVDEEKLKMDRRNTV